MNTIPLGMVSTKETLKKQKISLFSPLTSLTIRQSLSSKLQTDLSIQIQFVNSLNELFLEIPKTTTDYIGIDIEELCKDIGIQSFEIISTLQVLAECSTKNKKSLQIIGLADNTTNCKMIKDIYKDLNGRIICRLGGDFIYDDIYNDLYNLINNNYTISPKIFNLIKSEKRAVRNDNIINLTPRQRQILQIITAKGASNKTIAKLLDISESTVKLHISAIFKKYGVKNRTQLAVFSKNNTIN